MAMISLVRDEDEAGTMSPLGNPPLDTESLFAAIGLAPILAARPTLHKYQWRKAAGLPEEIRRRILRFISADAFAPANDVAEFDYGETLAQVSKGQLDAAQSRALMAAVPDKELAQDLGIQATRILTWADGIMPRDMRPSVLGAKPTDPDPHATADFRRVWQVALDPMFVLDELEDGSLSDDQVAALALLYPEIYKEIRQAIADQIAVMEARKGKDWEPAPQKAALLAMLRQEQQIDPELAATVQGVYAVQPDARQGAPAARRRARKASGGAEGAGEGLTPGSRQAGGVQ